MARKKKYNHETRPMMIWRPLVNATPPVTFLSALFASALLLTGCREAEPDARQLAPLVLVTEAAAPSQPERWFTGVVVARVQSDLGFRVAGKVVERLVDRGQAVKRGQTLMRMDIADLALASTARLAAVNAIRAKAAQSASDERRYRGLVGHGAISALAYEQAKSAADAAAAEMRSAEAQANVAQNEASYSVLVADADGVVVDTLAEPGQVVAAGQPVIKLAHAGPREAAIDLPETLRPALGSSAQARLYGVDGSLGSASLRQLAQAADPVSRTYEARYVLDGAQADAPLGSTITILIPDARRAAALQIPLSALADNGKGPGVWLIERAGQNEATTLWRAVTIAGISEETAALSAGLAPGDRFVAMGAHMLHAGDRVRVSQSPSVAVTQGAAQ